MCELEREREKREERERMEAVCMCVYVCVCGKGLLTRVALVTRLQPEGNMIKDRIYSMVRRNMLEHRERTKRYVMGAVCVCVCVLRVCVCVCSRARVCVPVSLSPSQPISPCSC